MYTVIVDQNLKEHISYQEESFPFQVCFDDYNSLVDHTLNCHWHKEFEFDLVLKGEVDFNLNGRQISVKAGECLFINSDTLHKAFQHKGAENAYVFVVVFRPELLLKQFTESSFRKYFDFKIDGLKLDTCSFEGRNVITLLQDIFKMDMEEYGQEFLCISLVAKLWYYMANCLKQALPAQQCQHIAHHVKVKKMLSYIHEHFREKITIQDLIEQANISRSDCFYYFKQYAGMSPLSYINDYRLSMAGILLADPDCNITDICFAFGFSNSSYFGKLFKEKYGVSPLQYRKRHSFH
ncbi:MAG: AraC family transcriptional regulator [Lachnospiraceae bacterium]|nr:AraC family transcriptional regulator [Lachnospiraceae bacterium]